MPAADVPPLPSRSPRLTPQSLATASDCPRRLWLHHFLPGAGAPPGEHILMLRERADAHERAIAARFENREGPLWRREGSFADAAAETLRLLRETRRPLYQPAFLSADGRRSAVPDLVYWDDDVLVVLDVRLALRPETRSDFALQLAHHRALIRETAGIEPGRFEIVNGYGETVVVEPAAEGVYAAALRTAGQALAATAEPDTLLAHSACRSCAYYAHCWDRAQAQRRIEVLPEVQSAHVAAWHAAGVRTLDQLAAADPARTPARVPPAMAKRAIVAAAAWRDNRAVWLNALELPGYPVVWFDLEGDSRGEDAEIPIYLWGFALDDGAGEARSEAIFAAFDAEGDHAAWERFVARATEILDRHPGIRWAHWDHYEPLWVRRYADRFGAPAGFLDRMNAACFDLKRVLDRCVRLPLRSYSIKHVARWMGFAWRNPDSGSEWSTARFHRARQSEDATDREALLRELGEYNEDDLLAMRAIWRWLAAHAGERA
jgi:uncharacterized protein